MSVVVGVMFSVVVEQRKTVNMLSECEETTVRSSTKAAILTRQNKMTMPNLNVQRTVFPMFGYLGGV